MAKQVTTQEPTGPKTIYQENWRKLSFKEFIYRFQIPICICFGLAGFVFSSLLLQAPLNTNLYGEVIMQNKVQILDTMYDRRSKLLRDSLISLDIANKKVVAADKPEYLKTRKMLINVLRNTAVQRYALDYGKSDTSTDMFNEFLFPDRSNYVNAIRDTLWSSKLNREMWISGFVIDTCRYLPDAPSKHATRFHFTQNKRKLMEFVSDYPLFGLWVVVTIAQMTLWFLLFPLLTGNVLALQSRFQGSYQITMQGIFTNAVIPFIFVVVFAVIFYLVLADDLIIRDEYYLSGFNTRILCYAIPGYLVATYGFATYISIARQVDMIDKNPKDTTIVSGTDTAVLFSSLKKAFDNAFLASSIILSLFVLWCGINITAIGGLETFKFYKGLSGKTLIPGDFIYLMGLLHTCILLVFYLPVKLKFNSLDIVQGASAADPNASTLKTLFSTLSDNLGTFLVATSPLIASFAHAIFSVIQK